MLKWLNIHAGRASVPCFAIVELVSYNYILNKRAARRMFVVNTLFRVENYDNKSGNLLI